MAMEPTTNVRGAWKALDPLVGGVLASLVAAVVLLLTQVPSLAGTAPSSFTTAARSAHNGSATTGSSKSSTGTTPQSAGASGGSSNSPKTIHVKISNYAFNPAKLTVAVGDTVVWTNTDSAPHTVTSSSGP